MSKLAVDQLTARTGTGTILIDPASFLSASGSVVQAVSKTFNTTTSTSVVQTYIDATDGFVEITPRFNNSSFFIKTSVQGYSNPGGNNTAIVRVVDSQEVRILGVNGGGGDTWMGQGNGLSVSNSYTIERNFLDSPNLAAGYTVTYKIQFGRWNASNTVWVNYPGYTGGSTITVMEIAQ
jgi:hypothetical protein